MHLPLYLELLLESPVNTQSGEYVPATPTLRHAPPEDETSAAKSRVSGLVSCTPYHKVGRMNRLAQTGRLERLSARFQGLVKYSCTRQNYFIVRIKIAQMILVVDTARNRVAFA